MVLTLYGLWRCIMWNELRFKWEEFKLRWLRVSAYTNRFNWDVVEPVKGKLYKAGLLREKPLRMEVEELNQKD